MKHISISDEPNCGPGLRQGDHVKVVKMEMAFSKAARQAAFVKSVAKMPVRAAVSRAKLIANVNPEDFRIVRMPG